MQTCIWPSWCHCHSLSLASVKSRLVLPFWYRLTRVVPEKGPLNGCVPTFSLNGHFQAAMDPIITHQKIGNLVCPAMSLDGTMHVSPVIVLSCIFISAVFFVRHWLFPHFQSPPCQHLSTSLIHATNMNMNFWNVESKVPPLPPLSAVFSYN